MKHAPITWEEAVEWGIRARAALDARGAEMTQKTLRGALMEVGAPFGSEYFILTKFKRTLREYREALIGAEAVAKANGPVDVANLPVVEPRTVHPVFRREDWIEVGEGVTVNRLAPHQWEKSWASLENAYEDRSRSQRAEVYRSVRIEVDHPDEPVLVIVMGDMHIGSASTCYRRLRAVAEQARRDDIKIYVVFVGDCVDAMIWPKVRFEGRSSPLSVHKEVLTAIGYLRAMNARGRVVGGVMGNHDLISEKMAGLSHFLLALEMGGDGVDRIPVAKNELLLDVVVSAPGREETYKWEIRHKVPGNSIYNDIHGGLRWNLFNHRDTEILCTGHIHKSGFGCKELHGKARWIVQCGAYKNSEKDDYVVEEGFSRGNNHPDFGVVLWANRHEIEVLETGRAIRTVEDEKTRRACSKASPTRVSCSSPKTTASSARSTKRPAARRRAARAAK